VTQSVNTSVTTVGLVTFSKMMGNKDIVELMEAVLPHLAARTATKLSAAVV